MLRFRPNIPIFSTKSGKFLDAEDAVRRPGPTRNVTGGAGSSEAGQTLASQTLASTAPLMPRPAT
jgi:hypothetical protein